MSNIVEVKVEEPERVEQLKTDPHPLTRYIMQNQQQYPKAKGDLTILLNSIQLACKLISIKAKAFGIHKTMYMDDDESDTDPNDSDVEDNYLKHIKKSSNITRDEMKNKLKQLSTIANKYMMSCLRWSGIVGIMASEETENQVLLGVDTSNIKDKNEKIKKETEMLSQTKYAVVFDPLDGFSNIDANASVGTIFGIYKLEKQGKPAITDLLQKGNKLVCAGYAMYGKATMMVLTFGRTVEGFTLDHTIGEFIHTHKDIKIPKTGDTYSINSGYSNEFDKIITEYIKKSHKNMRYVGSMVSDVHRTLLKGGIFMYPKTKINPKGKLRMLYELNPLGFILQTAGGSSIDGYNNILDIQPKKVNDTSPVFMGSKDDVEKLRKMYSNIK